MRAIRTVTLDLRGASVTVVAAIWKATAKALENDQPRRATLAGYLRPHPHSAGRGPRRAA